MEKDSKNSQAMAKMEKETKELCSQIEAQVMEFEERNNYVTNFLISVAVVNSNEVEAEDEETKTTPCDIYYTKRFNIPDPLSPVMHHEIIGVIAGVEGAMKIERYESYDSAFRKRILALANSALNEKDKIKTDH